MGLVFLGAGLILESHFVYFVLGEMSSVHYLVLYQLYVNVFGHYECVVTDLCRQFRIGTKQ